MSNPLFKILDSQLADTSGDFWYDQGASEAGETIFQFSFEDWNVLNAVWQTRPKRWQENLAYIIAHGDAKKALPLALDMLARAPDELKLVLLDTLRDMDFSHASLNVLVQIRQEAEQVSSLTKSSIEKSVLNDLIVQLKTFEFKV